jgi:hypothetical protein
MMRINHRVSLHCPSPAGVAAGWKHTCGHTGMPSPAAGGCKHGRQGDGQQLQQHSCMECMQTGVWAAPPSRESPCNPHGSQPKEEVTTAGTCAGAGRHNKQELQAQDSNPTHAGYSAQDCRRLGQVHCCHSQPAVEPEPPRCNHMKGRVAAQAPLVVNPGEHADGSTQSCCMPQPKASRSSRARPPGGRRLSARC